MRELKFRAWVYYGERLRKPRYSDDDWLCRFFEDCKEDDTDENGNPQCIEQYTGLKDKNGKEIYEGDIVSEEFGYGSEKTKTIWQVRWCDDECAFELHYVSGFEVDDCSLVADDEEDYEVIGNIHENTELLEQGNAKD